ncbi:MAG: BrnT family toxin [Deltaproteobacteria bacterium]|nr:BrnT family toxin [Deltaproteobacteria bacterium]
MTKHKVSFERAAAIFLDSFAISLFDDEHSQDEDRWITLGKDAGGILIVTVHTFRKINAGSCVIRIISARKASKKERLQYEG